MERATRAFEAGQLDVAARAWFEVLSVAPTNVTALERLGSALVLMQKPAEALPVLDRALQLGAPLSVRLDRAVAYQTLGRDREALEDLLAILEQVEDVGILACAGEIAIRVGRHQDAIGLLSRATTLAPEDVAGWANLGIAHANCKHFEIALVAFDRALSLWPNQAELHARRGSALEALERYDEALTAFESACLAEAELFEAHTDRARVLGLLDRWPEAVAAYEVAHRLRPRHGGVIVNIANSLRRLNRFDEALRWLDKLGAPATTHPEAAADEGTTVEHHGKAEALRGAIFLLAGDKGRAVTHLRRAVELVPDNALFHRELGQAMLPLLPETALVSLQRACDLDPEDAQSHLAIGNAFKEQGRLAEARGAYQRSVELCQASPTAYSNMIYQELFLPAVSLTSVLERHRQWEHLYGQQAQALAAKLSPLRRAPLGRRPRIAIVSSDLRTHPVSYFTVGVIEALATQAELFVYSSNARTDDDRYTRRYAAAATHWCDTSKLDDTALADQIRRDEVDIALDLAGHCKGQRLGAFLLRVAPLQVTWAGYMATTGLSTMDVLIADRHHVPLGAEAGYSEEVVRMPNAFIAYEPPSELPAIPSVPSERHGHVTFGSFNILAKLHDEVLTTWAKLLASVPNSRLLLKTLALTCPGTRARLALRLEAAGIELSRVSMMGGSTVAEHMAAIGEVDVALDPWPFSGSTTTLETMLMGVPVVTLPGSTFSSRHSLAFLSTVGLTEGVANSVEEYVTIAARLAQDRRRLQELRLGLRAQMTRSALCNAPQFAADFLEKLREAHARCLTKPRPSP